MTGTPPIVVGIDPSLTATGVAGPGGVRTVRSSGHDGDTLQQRMGRLHNLAIDVLRAVYEVGRGHLHAFREPAARDLLVVIEAPAYASKTGKNHDRSGLWWLIVDTLDSEVGAVEVVEVTTNQRMRYATGRGQADKDEVLAAAIRRYPHIPITNNNEADAVVLRAMGCDVVGDPIVTVPRLHRATLAGVRWPDYVDLEQFA